jgi:hypothetical protein
MDDTPEITKLNFKKLYFQKCRELKELKQELRQVKEQLEKIQATDEKINTSVTTSNTEISIFMSTLETQYEKKQKRNVWDNSEWKHISELENDDVGKIGERTIQKWCENSNIPSNIDGLKTKEKICGGKGDGTIYGKSVEIKTARIGSACESFQHELGETPWNAEFLIFLDIAPEEIFVTVFPNFNEDFYKKSGRENIKCEPYFPTRSICWRKQKGAFKLDTTVSINRKSKYTFTMSSNQLYKNSFKEFIDSIILS